MCVVTNFVFTMIKSEKTTLKYSGPHTGSQIQLPPRQLSYSHSQNSRTVGQGHL